MAVLGGADRIVERQQRHRRADPQVFGQAAAAVATSIRVSRSIDTRR